MDNKQMNRAGWALAVHLVVCLACALIMFPRPAIADNAVAAAPSVDPINDPEGYSAVLYNNTSGLPTSEANDIAQTSEGFIWIGSYSGLTRYDGTTFESLNADLGIGNVTCLFVDEQDRLWIGTNDNGLAMLDHGEVRHWGLEDGLGSTKICDIEMDSDGTLYIATSNGISMVNDDLTLTQAADHRVGSGFIDFLVQGPNGLVYCLTNSDDYFCLRKGRLIEHQPHTETGVQGMTCILPDPAEDGLLYIGTEGTTLYHGDQKQTAEEMEAIDVYPLVNVMDLKQMGDQIWICARNGIGILDGKGFHLLTDLPLENAVGHVMQDFEGNLWFTSTRQGVMKLVPNQFTDLYASYGLEADVVNTTCMFEGQLFIGTDTGLRVVDDNGIVSSVPLSSARTASGIELDSSDLIALLDGTRIRSIIRDSHDRLWISTWRSMGLVRYDHGEVVTFAEDEGLLTNHVRAVCEAGDDRMVIACTGGVCVIEGEQVVASYGVEDGITNPETLTVAVAPSGDILAGSDGGGIYVISEDGVRCIDTKGGLSSNIVMRIKYDAKRDLFWLVTTSSLAYLTTDYQVTTIKNFPYSNNFDLYENSSDEMWVLSSDGVYVVSTDELVANGEIEALRYGLANGLPCIATSNSYSELTSSGDLYIAGNTGVAKVNIEGYSVSAVDLSMAVPFIEADGTLYYPDETGSFVVPSRTRKLTIYAHVFNYSLDDPQVSYRLEGFDEEATTLRRSSLGPVSYTNLRGGGYRFVMSLQDVTGNQGRSISVIIIKEKALYEEPWFYALMILAGALVITAVVRAYVSRKVHALEEKHREEAERERISSELKMANEIQASQLPHIFPPFPERDEFELYASMNPAKEVGGDFYDYFFVDDDHLCLVIADVSGKGIPAALFMMISKTIVQSLALADLSAADALAKANETLSENNQTDMFVTVWLGILELSTGHLVAANAGHEYPAIRRADGSFELLKDRHGLMIGIMEGMRYPEYELQLGPGDQIFVYTDGVPEATNGEEQMFGLERMIDALNAHPTADPERLLQNVRAAVNEFVAGAEQYDDLTMLSLTYLGPQA